MTSTGNDWVGDNGIPPRVGAGAIALSAPVAARTVAVAVPREWILAAGVGSEVTYTAADPADPAATTSDSAGSEHD